MKTAWFLFLGWVGVHCACASTNESSFTDSNKRLLPLRRDVVRLMGSGLATKGVQVSVAQYRVDGMFRDLCERPGSYDDSFSPLDSWNGRLYELGLERYLPVETLTRPPRPLAKVIYVYEEGLTYMPDSSAPEYQPRATTEDSMWLLFLTPGQLRPRGSAEERAQIIGNPDRYTKSEVVIARDLNHQSTNAVLRTLGFEGILTPDSWFCLLAYRARFEVGIQPPAMPPLCDAAQRVLQQAELQRAPHSFNQDDAAHRHGILAAEFLDDLRLILAQMGGQTGAERFAKITATEKDMKSDFGKALLRELKGSAPVPTTPKRNAP
jgi:hypothetical protein